MRSDLNRSELALVQWREALSDDVEGKPIRSTIVQNERILSSYAKQTVSKSRPNAVRAALRHRAFCAEKSFSRQMEAFFISWKGIV